MAEPNARQSGTISCSLGMLLIVVATVLIGAGESHVVFGILGTAAAAVVIRGVVRWISRRDDPRFAKLPPDEP